MTDSTTVLEQPVGADRAPAWPGPSRRPRVLIVSENESIPSDRRVWAIGKTLVAAGCQVVVVCPQGDESERAAGEREPYEVLEGIEIHRFKLKFAVSSLFGYVGEYLSALWKTQRLVARLSREAPFDLVHVCNPPDFMFLACGPAMRRGARLIFDHHDLTPELFAERFGDHHRLLHKLTLLVERLVFRAANVVIATNESYREIAQRRGGKRPEDVFVVRNGPDIDEFVPVQPDPTLRRGKQALIAYVGVMAPQDGVDHAIRALAELAEHRRDWHAVFAGEGEARPDLERLVTKLGIEDCVEFAGWLADEEIMRLLSTSDICLAPEPRNPLNDVSTMVKIAEYLAMSCPVVAYDLIESRRSAGDAAVYAIPNKVSSYAAKIEELLDDPERRGSMGAIGRERVERELSWECAQVQLLAAYRYALAGRLSAELGSLAR